MARDTAQAAHGACTPVNRIQVAEHIARPIQHGEQAHCRTGAKWPRTPHTQHNTPSGHTGEQEPRDQGHRTPNRTHRAGTPVNRSQVFKDTAHAKHHTEPADR